MQKFPTAVAAFAIATSPVAVQAAPVTYGDLTYDAAAGPDIVNTVTGTRYLNLSEGKDWTYAVTLDMIANGGYGDYHIASQQEAFEFVNAFDVGMFEDTPGLTSASHAITNWADGSLGPNFVSTLDFIWFLSEVEDTAGYISINTTTLSIYDAFNTISNTDQWSAAGVDSNKPIPWLLVNDVTPVPLPATVWLMGSALVGLAGFARRKVGA